MNLLQIILLLLSVMAGAMFHQYQLRLTPADDVAQKAAASEATSIASSSQILEVSGHSTPQLDISVASPPPLRPRIQNPNTNWRLGTLDETTLKNMADVDAVLDLNIPHKDAGDAAFYRFAQQLKSLKMGRRYSAHSQTSPLLAADAYIAKYSPSTIYNLYNNREYDMGRLGHLIKYGYLQDWSNHIQDQQKLILQSHLALQSILMSKGKSAAEQAFLSAFFNFDDPTLRKLTVSVRNLRFAHPAMSRQQKNRLVTAFMNGERRVDNRRIRGLKQEGILTITRRQAIQLIKDLGPQSYEKQRSMSSYFGHAAGYGSEYFFRLMVKDVVDNKKQPNHFYCSACGVAVFGEGLLGGPLIDHVKNQRHYTIDKTNGEFVITGDL